MFDGGNMMVGYHVMGGGNMIDGIMMGGMGMKPNYFFA